ncbi:hypothetical protein SmJEL517_g02058 [Synchytrium microbalum]|uniref:FAD-binding domain-containing protein n=1 Tax=Synchytrium microbalum TaxID=1806994 RepID=A0A507CBZ5_9FUNG|nr:uncharacterized protein SmJEL517_g02058 [Synchytrium microbalum]TPX35464.1 hypothetical protein SmJEL517_g02058 [Synchytrium microbalum]
MSAETLEHVPIAVTGSHSSQSLGDFKELPRRIVIVGASVSGLTFLLALRRVCQVTGLALDPVIYDKKTTYYEQGPVYILWRWSIQLLMELGLGHGLQRIAHPITSLKSMDLETGDVYVNWPPAPESTQNTPEEVFKMGDPNIPAMMAVRHSDLVRLLLIALSGADEQYLASSTGECTLPNLSAGDWFEREGFLASIPELQMGAGLDSFLISAGNGLITARFDTGQVEQACMLIGADGLDSTVRDLLLNRHYPPEYANSAVISGVTNVFKTLEHPVPTTLSTGQPIVPLTPDIDHVFPDSSCTTYVGPKATFGVTTMGQGKFGWNLVLAQDEVGRIAEDWTQHLRSQRAQDPTYYQQQQQQQQQQFEIKPSDEKSELPAFQQQQQQVPPEQGTPFEEFLNGLQVRDMALHLASSLGLPESAYTIMALTDPEMTYVQDVFDVGGTPPPSYTAPKFHPGRIILIGDAAHGMATNAQGSLGAGLALTDAGLLAKLVGKCLIRGTDQMDETSLARLATDFDTMRVTVCNAIVNEARNEGAWNRVESSWVRSLFRGRHLPGSWRAASFYQMMTRGGIPHDAGLPTLSILAAAPAINTPIQTPTPLLRA